jgi:hypothetical protein
LSSLLLPPASLPSSETQGLEALDVQSNVFGNLPPAPMKFVQRPGLQAELIERVLDRNHPIITLHGRGGVGKTSLAIYVAHELAARDPSPFEIIVWFSARDVDLRTSGPSRVRPAVPDLAAVCKAYSQLFGGEPTEGAFAEALRTPTSDPDRGTSSSDFETVDAARQVH